jgi:hypothetical protein
MAKQPPKPQAPTIWDVYRGAADKGKLLGTVEADNAVEAIKKVAEEFKTDAWRLIAVQRR